MCGIAGLYSQVGRPVDLLVVGAMIRSQIHRGPDGEGYVLVDPTGKDQPVSGRGRLPEALCTMPPQHSLVLGHRRLAIIDLTPLGHQPMATAYGRCSATDRVRLYNSPEWRQE